jgi:hypothetical protein
MISEKSSEIFSPKKSALSHKTPRVSEEINTPTKTNNSVSKKPKLLYKKKFPAEKTSENLTEKLPKSTPKRKLIDNSEEDTNQKKEKISKKPKISHNSEEEKSSEKISPTSTDLNAFSENDTTINLRENFVAHPTKFDRTKIIRSDPNSLSNSPYKKILNTPGAIIKKILRENSSEILPTE